MKSRFIMRTLLVLIYCICIFIIPHAIQAQTCNDRIIASTPNNQLVDNGNGTITDTKTGLMWKQCVEGMSFQNKCLIGSAASFNWKAALEQPKLVNTWSGGFAGYNDWRLPNIKELRSIVETRCFRPAINLDRFPNTSQYSDVWSGSPAATNVSNIDSYAWAVHFQYGFSFSGGRGYTYQVRLVRDVK